jgi:hypothetical protein
MIWFHGLAGAATGFRFDEEDRSEECRALTRILGGMVELAPPICALAQTTLLQSLRKAER